MQQQEEFVIFHLNNRVFPVTKALILTLNEDCMLRLLVDKWKRDLPLNINGVCHKEFRWVVHFMNHHRIPNSLPVHLQESLYDCAQYFNYKALMDYITGANPEPTTLKLSTASHRIAKPLFVRELGNAMHVFVECDIASLSNNRIGVKFLQTIPTSPTVPNFADDWGEVPVEPHSTLEFASSKVRNTNTSFEETFIVKMNVKHVRILAVVLHSDGYNDISKLLTQTTPTSRYPAYECGGFYSDQKQTCVSDGDTMHDLHQNKLQLFTKYDAQSNTLTARFSINSAVDDSVWVVPLTKIKDFHLSYCIQVWDMQCVSGFCTHNIELLSIKMLSCSYTQMHAKH